MLTLANRAVFPASAGPTSRTVGVPLRPPARLLFDGRDAGENQYELQYIYQSMVTSGGI